ncbi:MAG: gamma-glutamyltransferase [Pseudomonadota bacterium]
MRDFALPGRSPIYGTGAMAATSHPQATRIAVETMRDGGNAVDAAIAAAAVLTVVEPHMTGIGGDCFALIAEPGRPVTAINGAGRAPDGLSLDTLTAQGITALDIQSPHSVTVPGAIAAWDELALCFGTRPLGDLLAPAISFAKEGYVVAPRIAADWAGQVGKLATNAGACTHLLRDGAAPAVGTVWSSPALATTLETIAHDGARAFYEGDIAEDIVTTLRDLGGVHTRDDFARQTAQHLTPVASKYAGLDLYQLPPSNSGIVANLMLHILARVDAAAAPAHSARRYHLFLEAARLAYAARNRFIADPEQADVPVDHFLSNSLADELASRIDPERRAEDLGSIPDAPGSDTIYLCVVDAEGRAVSLINSIYSAFGSGIVTEKTGIVLHNRGQGFSLELGHPNVIAPRKRPLHTLLPAIACRDGRPEIVFGVMGALFQPMGQVYVLTNLVDHGMDPQQALDFPRIFFEDDHLEAESGVAPQTVDALREMGHDVRPREEAWGGGQVIRIDQATGVLTGASDPRKDGCALGW